MTAKELQPRMMLHTSKFGICEVQRMHAFWNWRIVVIEDSSDIRSRWLNLPIYMVTVEHG